MRSRTALLVLGAATLLLVGLAAWQIRGAPPDRTARRLPVPDPVAAAPEAPETPAASATLVVEVSNGRGAPVAGVDVSLTDGPVVVARASTDAGGTARFIDRTEREVDVWVHPQDGDEARLPAGRFLPPQGDARIAYVLRPARKLVLEVRCDGNPGLPKRWRVAEPVLFRVTADAKSGVIRGLFCPPREDVQLRIRFVAPAFMDGGKEVHVSTGTDPVIARIDLLSGHQLLVRWGRELSSRELRVEQEAADGSWREVAVDGMEESASGAVAFTYPVAIGRCRLVLASSGAIVAETTVRSGDTKLSLSPDLERAGWCDVRVEVPEGYDPRRSVLVIAGDRLAGPPWPQGRGGEWRAFVPGDRTLKAHATHPLLVPAATGGEALLSPGGAVVLRMVPGPLLRFRFGSHGSVGGFADVALRPRPGAEPVFRGTAVPDGPAGELALTGWEPGVYTVTVDPFEGVPVTLDARLDPQGTDLGDLPFARGSRVEVVGGEGRIQMSATSETQPGIRRRSSPGTGRVLEGLAAGTWDVRIEALDLVVRRSVTVDGVTDVTIAVDAE